MIDVYETNTLTLNPLSNRVKEHVFYAKAFFPGKEVVEMSRVIDNRQNIRNGPLMDISKK